MLRANRMWATLQTQVTTRSDCMCECEKMVFLILIDERRNPECFRDRGTSVIAKAAALCSRWDTNAFLKNERHSNPVRSNAPASTVSFMPGPPIWELRRLSTPKRPHARCSNPYPPFRKPEDRIRPANTCRPRRVYG